MKTKIKELEGKYPSLRGIEQTLEYQTSFKKVKKTLDLEWEPIEEAAKILYKKLDNYKGVRLQEELNNTKERELRELEGKLETESRMAYNLRRIGEILTLTNSPEFTPLLLTRNIQYCKEWESWSLGAGEDHGRDLVTKREFSQALDFSIGEEIGRLGVAGEITSIKRKPQIRIRHTNLELISRPRYGDLIEHLKNKLLDRPRNPTIYKFGGEKWEPDLIGFYIDTKISPDDFLIGKTIVEFWKQSTIEEIIRPYSTQEEGYIQFIRGVKQIAKIINSQIGHVPYQIQKGSYVHYNPKTGEPME